MKEVRADGVQFRFHSCFTWNWLGTVHLQAHFRRLVRATHLKGMYLLFGFEREYTARKLLIHRPPKLH